MSGPSIVTKGTGEVLLLACGALAREITDLIDTNGWTHMELHCLPAIWHNHPEQIAPAVEDVVTANRERYQDIFVVYADCGTGGALQATCERLGVSMVPGPHCYSFFEGNEQFANNGDDLGTFYLTDFLVRQFDAFVWRPLRLDQHIELRDMYFGQYTKLVYQAQIDDPKLTALAEDYAKRLGLVFEHRMTGYGDLATQLADLRPSS
ncbi:MAG: DUF1638 domain-containing protein [Marinovum sp.]|nr:DUF1638 domain-containing protein [Marinovum sp.]